MKNDYNRNTFWTNKDEQGDTTYYMKINGIMIQVNEDVYKVCKNSYMKMAYQNKKDSGVIISLNTLNEHYSTFYDSVSNTDNELLKNIKLIIEQLDQPFQDTLIKYYFEHKNVYEIAKEMNVLAPTVSKRLAKGIKKIKKFL